MEPKIGMISSSLELIELTRRVADKLGVKIEIDISALERAIPAGKDFETKGTEVIISRGGTAAILRNNLSIPVLSIPVSLLDLLENVHEAAKYGRKIGITAYGAPISGIKTLERIFQVEIKQIVYHDSESLVRGIAQAKDEGLEVLICGNFSFQISQEMGLHCILISSAEETIARVIDEARVVAVIGKEGKEKMRHMEAILDSVFEGVLSIDKNGQVVIFNRVAEDILGIKRIQSSSVRVVVSQLGLSEVIVTGMPKLQHLQKVGEVQLVTNLKPILMGEQVIGAIASFSDVPKLMRTEQKIRKSYASGFVAKYTMADIVGKSEAVKGVIEQARKYAQSDSTLLITGESGTGKELVAQTVHNLSPRNKEPFVSINCSALPESLLESELFGYAEGAFTGASKGGKMGLFELAHKGTIFLDEIGSISEALQSRLLRVLQQKEVMRIGGGRIIPVDVRIIAATNRDLLPLVKEGRFRLDLYFRINVLRIHIPPLRDRGEDIFLLVSSLLDFFAKKYGKELKPLPERELKKFLDYSWPGNIRELQNFIERFTLMVRKPNQYQDVLSTLFQECLRTEKILREDATICLPDSNSRKMFGEPNLKKGEIAKKLGVSRTTLWRRLKSSQQTN